MSSSHYFSQTPQLDLPETQQQSLLERMVSLHSFLHTTVVGISWSTVVDGPRIGLEFPSYSVEEDDVAARVCVSLTQPVSSPVTATISTADLSAMGKLYIHHCCRPQIISHTLTHSQLGQTMNLSLSLPS